MEQVRLKTKIIFKHETEANWAKSSYIPQAGEPIVVDSDGGFPYSRFKLGDGYHKVSELPYASETLIDTVKLPATQEEALAGANKIYRTNKIDGSIIIFEEAGGSILEEVPTTLRIIQSRELMGDEISTEDHYYLYLSLADGKYYNPNAMDDPIPFDEMPLIFSRDELEQVSSNAVLLLENFNVDLSVVNPFSIFGQEPYIDLATKDDINEQQATIEDLSTLKSDKVDRMNLADEETLKVYEEYNSENGNPRPFCQELYDKLIAKDRIYVEEPNHGGISNMYSLSYQGAIVYNPWGYKDFDAMCRAYNWTSTTTGNTPVENKHYVVKVQDEVTSYHPWLSTITQRNFDGNVKVPTTPVDSSDATSKSYVDSKLNLKIDKNSISASNKTNAVLARVANGGAYYAIPTALNPTGKADLPQRNAAGEMFCNVSDTSSSTAVVNKQYADKIKAIAKGALQAEAFLNYAEFVDAVNAADKTEWHPGQPFNIKTKGVPDLWVYDVLDESVPYTYIDDETIVNTVKESLLQVGYYRFSDLETNKIDDTSKADKVHTHVAADITDLDSININADTLDGKHAEEFADAEHNHDDMYYTESEVDTKVSDLQTQINRYSFASSAVKNYQVAMRGSSGTLFSAPYSINAEANSFAYRDGKGEIRGNVPKDETGNYVAQSTTLVNKQYMSSYVGNEINKSIDNTIKPYVSTYVSNNSIDKYYIQTQFGSPSLNATKEGETKTTPIRTEQGEIRCNVYDTSDATSCVNKQYLSQILGNPSIYSTLNPETGSITIPQRNAQGEMRCKVDDSSDQYSCVNKEYLSMKLSSPSAFTTLNPVIGKATVPQRNTQGEMRCYVSDDSDSTSCVNKSYLNKKLSEIEISGVNLDGYVTKDNLAEALEESLDHIHIDGKAYKISEGLEFVDSEDGLYVYPGTCTDDIIVVPSYYKGQPVRRVHGFANSTMTEIILPDTLEVIQTNAFTDCTNLKKVIIKSVLEIREQAFYNCTALEEVFIDQHSAEWCSIPDYFYIMAEAFSNAGNPETGMSITIGKHVQRIPYRAFANSNISQIKFEETSSCQYIGDHAFADCSMLRKVSLANSIKTIETEAFINCINLAHIYMPSAIESIRSMAFYNCLELKHLHIRDIANWCNVYLEDDVSHPLSSTSGTGTGRLYLDDVLISDLVIPEGVTKINQLVFRNCANIKNISFPKTLTNIDLEAFTSCDGLTELVIPENVVFIDTHAFLYCLGLKKLHISGHIDNIDPYTFASCENLSSAIIPGTVAHCIPKGFIEEVIVTGTTVSDEAFRECTNLKKVTLEDTITSLGYECFNHCEKLEEIILSKNLRTIGNSAFVGCSKLSNIIIPKSVTDMGYSVFQNNPLLTIYCEADAELATWDPQWNWDSCNVVWGFMGDIISVNNSINKLPKIGEWYDDCVLDGFNDLEVRLLRMTGTGVYEYFYYIGDYSGAGLIICTDACTSRSLNGQVRYSDDYIRVNDGVCFNGQDVEAFAHVGIKNFTDYLNYDKLVFKMRKIRDI